MANLMYIQVIGKIIEMTKANEMKWNIANIAQFMDIEPDLVPGTMYTSVFRNQNMVMYEERIPPFKNQETHLRLQFFDDTGKIVGDFPNVYGVEELYLLIKMQHRDPIAAEMDKLVLLLTEESKKRKLNWKEEKIEQFEELDPDVVTSSIYLTEFKGKRFVLYQELSAASQFRKPRTMTTLWIVNEQYRKIRDFAGTIGLDDLFDVVLYRSQEPDMSGLDKMIDTLVANSIKDIVQKITTAKQ
jgi:hypothetical protein